MKRISIILLAMVALLACTVPASAQLLGSFTLTSPGVSTNGVIEDPGSSVLELPSVVGNMDLFLSGIALVNGKGTGTVTAIFRVSPDNVVWTSTNDPAHQISWRIHGATNAAVIHTNIDVTGFRYLKLGGLVSTDTESAVTNVGVTYYKKRP